ncbi:MAG: oligoendopeptidase F [Chloroflexia bacterium]
MAKTLLKRTEVPVEHTWDITSVYPTDDAWDKAYQEAKSELDGLGRFEGKLAESPATLLEGLSVRDEYMARASRIYVYAGMQSTGDVGDQEAQARTQQALGLLARAGGALAYFEPELLAIAPDKLEKMVSEEPGLATYRHYLDKLSRRREHVRSSEVESILAEAADLAYSPYTIRTALEDADLKFATIKDEEGNDLEIQQGNVWSHIRSQNRDVRKAAWEAYADGYIGMKNTFATSLAGGVKRDVFYARSRKYSSSLEAALAENNIPVEVYNSLLDTFKSQLPVWHRFWEIKRRALGVDSLHGYDIDVPIIRNQRNLPYSDAMEKICAGMAPLGDEYATVLKRGLYDERWVDIYPNQGKGSGAFSFGTHGTHPFLMLNYNDSLEEMSTLAHELGHSMHSYFSWDNQPPVYGFYSMFVAETASNFNQAMVRAHLLKTEKDPDFELEVLAEAMSNFHRYFFIMPTLARFELDCHEKVEQGEGLTADSMSAKLTELFREAYGPSVTIDEERVGITWAQFPHLFGNFYVFQYATGISAANALADGILKGDGNAAQSYLNFLKSGDSLYPLDALKLAGIDMSTPEPVERAFGVMTRMIDRLDELVGEGPIK